MRLRIFNSVLFACAVSSDDAERLSLLYLKGYVVQGPKFFSVGFLFFVTGAKPLERSANSCVEDVPESVRP